jgi:riboflavin kinase/FMN adenylyltransferase
VNVAHRPDELEPARRAVAIGTFDGVHRGHVRVLEAALATGLRPAVVTFDPHPRTHFGGDVPLLATLERRLQLLDQAGIEDVLVCPFDDAMAELTAEEFAGAVLGAAGAEVVAAGDGFRFGRGRSGDLALLERLGFDVRRVPIVDNVSSSHIRSLLDAGDVVHAAQLLGRAPEVEGTVVTGDRRGAGLGFPTANLAIPSGLLVPALGIYAGSALGHRAAISIGTNPTFGGTERRVEAHLLDYDGDLYGQRLIVELWERLRDEAAFGSEAELVEAIAADVRRTREAKSPGGGLRGQ